MSQYDERQFIHDCNLIVQRLGVKKKTSHYTQQYYEDDLIMISNTILDIAPVFVKDGSPLNYSMDNKIMQHILKLAMKAEEYV